MVFKLQKLRRQNKIINIFCLANVTRPLLLCSPDGSEHVCCLHGYTVQTPNIMNWITGNKGIVLRHIKRGEPQKKYRKTILINAPLFSATPYGPENCLETNWLGTGPWNDVNCEKRIRKFVCEFPVSKY
jgi:hypothetical protein